MATTPRRVAQMVPVQFLQEDMHGFEQDLRTSAYDLQDMYGKRLFTEKVLWGEVWIADRTSKETWWAGYIRDGELYLDQSSRNRFLYNRKHTRQIPSLLPVGNYKIWLDAWVRQGDYAYVGDAFFTKDGLHDLAWSAPPVPQRKHWQDIEVRPPKEPGEPHRISVRSRRFHWVYRVSRLIDTLDQLLHPHEYMIANVANVRRDAAYLREFLGVLYQSGTNMNKIETRRTIQGQDEWGQMQMTLLAVMNRCENFIAFGWGGVGSKAEESALRERQHINNVAHLLWRLINNEHFAKDVEFYEEAFAAEHRVILSRLGAVFNRVPRAVASVSPWLDSRNNFVDRPHHLSIPYGEKFAKQLTLPYFNYKAEEDGGTPPFKSASKPASAVKWLNSTRRYGISMLNAASIWVSTKEVNWEHMRKLLEKQAELIAQSDLILRSRYPDTFKLMDKLTDRVLERARSLGRLTARLEKEALHQRQELAGKLRGADPEMDGELKKFDQSLQGIADEIETREPQKMLDALKKSNPNVVYGVEAFEICVKWVVMWSTWNAFWQAYKENGGLRKETAPKMADSLLKTADFASSVLRSAGFARILQASWMNKIASTVSEEQILRIQKWGKGLSAVADVGSAVLYTYEVFSSETYKEKLLEKYTPNDAVTIYGFNLVTWAGKWLVAAGSVGNFGGLDEKLPGLAPRLGPLADPGKWTPSLGRFKMQSGAKLGLTATLQGIGYILQFVGEFGAAWAAYGADARAHFLVVLSQMREDRERVRAILRERKYEVELYTADEEDKMKRLAGEEFEWLKVEEDKYHAAFGSL